jgi:hypothetical protein
MSTTQDGKTDIYPAMVAEVIDDYKVVINRGVLHGVKVGDRFLIYKLTDEIIDPETKEPLGRLELSKGTGKAILVLEKMALIESDREKRTIGGTLESIISPEKLPFDKPKQKDKAKPI